MYIYCTIFYTNMPYIGLIGITGESDPIPIFTPALCKEPILYSHSCLFTGISSLYLSPL